MLDRYVHWLRVCEHFVSELVFDAFVNVKPVKIGMILKDLVSLTMAHVREF